MTNLNCSGCHQRRTAPQHADSRNELVRAPMHSRVNGWSLPLHGFQLITWLMYSFMAIVGFGIYIPLLPSPWRFAAYGLIGAAFVLHLFTHVAAVTIDPADLSVRTRKDYSSPMRVFDNTKHQHVIDNLHCSLCEVDVGPKAKHCSTCNKCIADFDHHCKWLNNCVGGRNYRLFFITISSAVCGMFLLTLVVLFVFIGHYVNPAVLRTAPQFQTVKGNGTWLVFLPAAPLETSSISLAFGHWKCLSTVTLRCPAGLGEPTISLPVGWNLSRIEKPQAPGQNNVKSEGIPIVQDPLGSSIMDATVVHQQLITDTQPEAMYPLYLGFKERMP
ncbi:palmitoyltransferase ZDHHC11-like [Myxocyprinus asiaticus]|uniref:palmitoyltransferase ZDHHC11-like n=1 Tax=Myxocyprinus asiaticus TaxID=70543 RepID=UPI002223707A|nr:palmitoyltransferase ZDHHC11-like [Myxocyprinus asiaticus]